MLTVLADAFLDPLCASCELPFGFEAAAVVCPSCAAAWHACRTRAPVPGIPELRAAWDYAGSVRSLILRAKEDAQGAQAQALWSAARVRCPELWIPPPRAILVPAPSSHRRRNGALADRLARHCAKHSGHLHRAWLRRSRRRPAQASLAGSARRLNLRHAIQLRPRARLALRASARLRAHPIWLLDDVATTGATLEECARALRAADLRVAGATVLARVA